MHQVLTVVLNYMDAYILNNLETCCFLYTRKD